MTIPMLMAAWVVLLHFVAAVTSAVWIFVKQPHDRVAQDEAVAWLTANPAFRGIRLLALYSGLLLAVLVLATA